MLSWNLSEAGNKVSLSWCAHYFESPVSVNTLATILRILWLKRREANLASENNLQIQSIGFWNPKLICYTHAPYKTLSGAMGTHPIT